MPTVSIVKGKGYARHNDRSINNKDIHYRSWSSEKSAQNIIYKNDPIEKAYSDLFGAAVQDYNDKQVKKCRPDRQIKNYYEKITRSKQEKTSYEFIIQIGSIEDKKNPNQYSQIQSALDEYNHKFQQRNPNFYVFQQITHRDEEGMDHTHIQFIPFSTGNKRGVETKTSLSGALNAMGYGRNGFDLWRANELQELSSIMASHGLDFELGDGRTEHLNVRQYREFKKYETMASQKQNTLSELEKSISRAKTDLDLLKVEKSEIDAQIAQKQAYMKDLGKKIVEINNLDSLKAEKNDLIEQNNILVRRYNHLAEENSQLLKDRIQADYEKDMANVLSSYLWGFIDFLLHRILVHFMDITPIYQKFEDFCQKYIHSNEDIYNCFDTAKGIYQEDLECGVYQNLNNEYDLQDMLNSESEEDEEYCI